MITYTLENITPEAAKEYLAKNEANRTIHARVVSSLAREITNGTFRTTHQPIAFFEDGSLADGQHRLSAVIEANAPICCWVARGLERQDSIAIDKSIRRSVIDSFQIAGLYHDDVVFRHKKTFAFVRFAVTLGYNSGIVLSESELIRFINAWNNELRFLYSAYTCRSGGSAVPGAAVLAALLCGEDKRDLDAFCYVFLNTSTDGMEKYNIDAALKWSMRLERAKQNRQTLSREVIYNGTQNAIWSFLHKSNTSVLKTTGNFRYPIYDKVEAILKG